MAKMFWLKPIIINFITNEADLKGLPDGAKEMAASLAKSKELEGWVFTLISSYLPL
jgi:peptidyl-dipeptidase Dcp